MSGTETVAGTTIGISAAAPATFDKEGYDAVAMKTIGKITGASGEIGRAYDLVTSQYLAERGTGKRKGTFNEGNLSLTLDVATEADEGQDLVLTARDSDDDHYLAITYQNGDKLYMPVQVMSFRYTGLQSPNNMRQATSSFEIVSPGVVLARAA